MLHLILPAIREHLSVCMNVRVCVNVYARTCVCEFIYECIRACVCVCV